MKLHVFLTDRRAGVAMIVAVCAPVLFFIVAFGTDYAYASYINQRLSEATDAAVLAAVSQSAANAGGGYGNTASLQASGQSAFNFNTRSLHVSNVNLNLTVVPNATGGVVANAAYTYPVPTFFAGILGVSSIPVSGKASATANPVTYINYYLIVDVSQSMGVASTPTDEANLYSRVVQYGNGSGGEVGCVFGCHVTAAGQSQTNEALAHNISPKITLRVDAAVAAIQDIIGDAQAAAGAAQNIQIAIYTMSQDPVSGILLRTISPLSSNYSNLSTLAATIDLGSNVAAGFGDTNFPVQLSQFNAILPANGSGGTSLNPKNYVFMITDGLVDIYNPLCLYTHCTSAFDPSICTPLKAKATVGTIYTTYNPIYNANNPAAGLEGNYSTFVAPYANQIAPNLQNCATAASYYYQANDGPGITAGMEKLFASSQLTARITQ